MKMELGKGVEMTSTCEDCRAGYERKAAQLQTEIKELREENESFKRIISNQGDRHKLTQIKNEKLSNELNRLEENVKNLGEKYLKSKFAKTERNVVWDSGYKEAKREILKLIKGDKK